MSKITKKIASISLAITTIVWLSGATLLVPKASALTNDELQAQITALLAQIALLQAQLGGTTSSTACTFTRDLTLNVKGDDVKCLQKYLNGAGYPIATTGVGSTGNETTFFGSLTKTAVAKWQTANSVLPTAGYFGAKSRAKYTSLAGGGGTNPPPPVGTGLAVTLAFDNPAAASIPKGATAIPFLKVNISGSGTLDTLIFKRVGAGSTADFSSGGINLYDGESRLTSGKSLNSTDHTATFVNLALPISGTKTLLLTGNTLGSATAGDVNAFQLVSAAGTPTPTGFPVTGNSMVIGGATVGGFAINDGSAPSNPNIGAVEAKLLSFTITASSSEDIEVSKVAFTQGGTVNNDYLTNFKLKFADQVLATATKIGAKQIVTLNFTTPYKIEKGQVKTFDLYGDISGSARSSDTVIFYVDNAADVVAKGLLYGYTVLPDITPIDTSSESDTLTLQGAAITINFTGPVAGDVALRGADVELFRFNFTSKNNIEIKNFRFGASTTGVASVSGEGFNDFKLWDAVSNTVLTSATDITTTSTVVTFTDTVNVNANQTRTFKITADVDSDDDTGDTIAVKLLSFSGSNDIRNLDNNTYVTASSDITPNADITGNTQTVKSPALDVNLSASPGSVTRVQGTQNVALVGFTFKAVADDIKMTQLKVYATSSTGTLTTAELTNLKLYDGDTQLGDAKSLDSSITATFSNFNLTIPKDTTKILTVKGNIATDATDTDVFYVYINALTDVTDYDLAGNTVTNSGDTANSGGAVKVTVASVGDVTVQALDTTDDAGIILAGTEQVLGNFRFTATNEDMTLKDVHVLINDSASATATTTATGDDVPFIRLYDGTALLTGGSSNCSVNGVAYTGCYSVPISGASSSIVQVSNLNWVIPSNQNKTLTVKGLVDKVGFSGQYADSGSSIYANIMAAGFKASGQTTNDSAITAASGQQKVIYKTKPTLSKITGSYTLSAGNSVPVFMFRVAADSAGEIEWKKVQFYVTMSGATMSAPTTSNTTLRSVTSGTSLTLSTIYSGVAVASDTALAITGGNSGYLTLEVTTPERVSVGSYKDYEVQLPFANLVTSPGANISINVTRQETTLNNGTWYAGITGSIATSGIPSFVWSDYSSSSHATSTGDWANGRFIKTFSESSNVHN